MHESDKSARLANPSRIWKETAELVGVLGIIAGILFLGYEIRQNTIAVRSEASQGMQNQITSIYEMLLNDPMMKIYLAGMSDPSSLSATDRAKFHSFWTVVLQSYENMFFQIREGTYDSRRAEGWWQLLRDNLAEPGGQAAWESRGYLQSDEFRQFVETEVMGRNATAEYVPLGVTTQ